MADRLADAPAAAVADATAVVEQLQAVAAGSDEDEETVEALEDLILEAYNNMQSDGEFIFLPEDVAQKLHQAARLLQTEDPESSKAEAILAQECRPKSSISLGPNAASSDTCRSSPSSDSVAKVIDSLESCRMDSKDQPEPEQEGDSNRAPLSDSGPQREVLLPNVMSSERLFSELPPVLETDEEASSGPSSPAGGASSLTESSTSSIPPPPAPSKPHDVSASSMANSAKRSATPSPAGTPRSVDRKKKADPAAASTYEKRRRAAQKLKDEKARRAQEKHDAAQKQREDARRQLEEAHRKEMEEKRERVRRMRQQREQRKTATGKPARS